MLIRFTPLSLRALPLLALLTTAAGVLWPTWPPLAETWRVMPEYSYAMLLMPFIACWIAARSTDLPPAAPASWLASASLVAGLVAWLVAYKAASSIGQQLLVPLILWTSVWTAFGLPIAARLAAPIACLYFAIPVWEFLVPGMQRLAVLVAETVLGWLGVPVHIDGVLVSIPEGTFQIAEGCAGRRYLIVALAIAGLLAGTGGMRPRRAAAFLALTAVLALVTNWVRVLTVIYAGHITHMTSYLVAREHLTLGWVLFALLMVVVCLIGARLMHADAPAVSTAGPKPAYPVRALLLRPALPATVLLLCIPVVGIVYASDPVQAARRGAGPVAGTWPARTGVWSGPVAADSKWQPRYPGAVLTGRAAYRAGDATVEVFVAEYRGEQRGAKLVSGANTLVPADWMIVRAGELASASRGALPGAIGTRWARSAQGEPWLVSYQYRVGPVATPNPLLAQLAYGVLSWTRPVTVRIVAAAVRCPTGSCNEQNGALAAFWSDVGSQLALRDWAFPDGDTR